MVDRRELCPDPEILAAYVDHRLSLAERARLESHLSFCRQCIGIVAAVVRTASDISHSAPAEDVAARGAPSAARQTILGVFAAAAAVFVVLAVPPVFGPWLDRDADLVSLATRDRERRTVLGQLSGGFQHAPLDGPSGQSRPTDNEPIVLAAAKIRESFGERGTSSRLHALGISQLLAGYLDDAAESLLAASRAQPQNARYLTDVAAVQLERARLGLRPDDLPRALASADRARRLDPSLREAWFNRALATTALSLTEQAKTAWTEYLARDDASPWAAEARTHLQDLSRPTIASAWIVVEQRLQGPIDVALADEAVRTEMTEARNFVEGHLLPAWASAVESGNDAATELDRIRVMADAFARVAGDALYQDAVTAIDRAGATRGALAKAHRLYSEAATMFAEDRMADAKPVFETVRRDFENASSPFSIRAAIDLGAIAYVTGRPDESVALFSAAGAAARNRYPFAAARCTWYQGLLAFGRGQLAETQYHYEETLATLERLGDVEQAGAVYNLLASLHDYLGDAALGWKHRDAALSILDVSRSPRLRFQILLAAAGAVRREDAETALILQDAVIDAARRWGRPAAIADSLAQRADILFALGRTGDAERTLADARQSLNLVPDAGVRRRVEVSLLAVESNVARATSPEQAARAATSAIQLVDARRDRRRLAQLHLRLAKANIVWGRLADAEAALARGINAFEEERRSLNDEGRVSTLDESWDLYDTAIQLAIRKKDYARAFAMAERSRARTLAEARRWPERSLSDVQRMLPEDQAILALNQFDDELAVWVIGRRSTTVVTRPVTRAVAVSLVGQQRDEILRAVAPPNASGHLFNEIVRPVKSALEGVTRIVVVPDSTYESAAFAALWDPARREFLVENVSVTLAPTVSAYAVRTQQRFDSEPTDPLILSGPDAEARDRATAVTSAYRSSELITAPTGPRFLSALERRPVVVHLSARVSPNAAFPLLSRVMFSDEPGQRYSGSVQGREIASRALAETRVVVIDNVESQAGGNISGSLSMARAFIAAGVPAVLGTLPGADEDATRGLMVSFHREMSTGISAEQALSTLQRNVLHSNGRRIGAWSALVLYSSDR